VSRGVAGGFCVQKSGVERGLEGRAYIGFHAVLPYREHREKRGNGGGNGNGPPDPSRAQVHLPVKGTVSVDEILKITKGEKETSKEGRET